MENECTNGVVLRVNEIDKWINDQARARLFCWQGEI
jgi:hypothetical protein